VLEFGYMKAKSKFSAMAVALTMGWCLGCSSPGPKKAAAPSKNLEAQLKVSGANSQLKAKLMLKNTGSKEILINDLNSRFFKVETLDSKPMEAKALGAKPGGAVRLKPGESVETAFSLHENYSFWDRLTRYKIWYDGPEVKSNVVQVWF